jgi:hypothetical protein
MGLNKNRGKSNKNEQEQFSYVPLLSPVDLLGGLLPGDVTVFGKGYFFKLCVKIQYDEGTLQHRPKQFLESY